MNTHAILPASPAGTAELIRYIAGETCIAIAVNVAIGAVATWLLADTASLAHASLAAAAKQLVMPTLGPASALVPGITSVTRKRMAKGTAPCLHLPAWARLPHNLVARAVIIGLASFVLLGGPAAILLYYYVHAAPIGFTRLLLFMLGYGAAFGLVVAPVTVAAALGDRPERQESVPGKRAAEIRLVNESVPLTELKQRVRALADVLIAKNPAALKAAKHAVRRVQSMTYDEAEDYLVVRQESLNYLDKSDGRHEAIRQFIDEKSYKPGLASYKL